MNENLYNKLWKIGGRMCHQKPDRSFRMSNGKQFPLCTRCTGFYIGMILGIFILVVMVIASMPMEFFVDLTSFFLAWIFGIPVIIDWGLQHYKGIMSNNHRRYVTGFCGGVAVAIVAMRMIALWI